MNVWMNGWIDGWLNEWMCVWVSEKNVRLLMAIFTPKFDLKGRNDR